MGNGTVGAGFVMLGFKGMREQMSYESKKLTSVGSGWSARSRWISAVAAAAVAVTGFVVIPTGAAVAATPLPHAKVVLDPDNNFSHADWGGIGYTELPITYQISTDVKTRLVQLCAADVSITRDASQDNVSNASRASQMQDANLSLTISLNNLTGTPWGTSKDGGASSFTTAYSNNLAFGTKTLEEWTRFTGRQQQAAVNMGGTNGTTYPYAEFQNLPGTYAHTFFGFMDHNFDWPAISGTYQGTQYGFEIDAIVTALGRQLQDQGFTCGNVAAGQLAFPDVPSKAELAQLYTLGYESWQKYGADPVNFGTGNFLTGQKIFTVTGPGGTSTDAGLLYNSQDDRKGAFGRGWVMSNLSSAQSFSDGSVLVTLGNGQAVAFATTDGGKTFTPPKGVYAALVRDGSSLRMADGSGQKWLFTENSDTGVAPMTTFSDRQGNTWAYTYAMKTVTIPGQPNPWPVAPDGSSFGTAIPPRDIQVPGALASITVPGGQVITYESGADGLITGIVRPDGAKWALAYTNGLLTSVSDPLGRTTAYSYDGAGRIASTTNPDGVVAVANTYDDQGRVVKQVGGDGQVSSISYGTDGTTTFTDPMGAKTVYTRDTQNRIVKIVSPTGGTQSITYDGWQIASVTDGNGNQTSNTYDSAGRSAATKDGVGATSTTTFTPSGDVASTTDANGNTTSYTVDSTGHTTASAGPDGAKRKQSFDSAGNVVSRTDPNGNVTTYGYDGRGNLTSITDPTGAVSTLAYDGVNRLVSSTDPLGRVTQYGYDLVGNLTSRTDPAGGVTAYTYQADDKVESITDPTGAVTRYTYTHGQNIATVTDPTGAVTTYGYDANNRRTSMTDADGHTTSYVYDGNNHRVRVTDPNGGVTVNEYDQAGNVVKITDPAKRVTKIAYDADNRPIKVTDPGGGTSTLAYDANGNVTTTTDQLGHATKYQYDAANRVLKVTDPTGATATTSYDLAGNITGQTDATGRTDTFGYDKMNRVITSTDPAGNQTKYSYDAAGQLVGKTDAEGRPTSYGYTPNSDMASVTDGLGAITTFSYDPNGKVTGITDPQGGAQKMAYDPLGRLTAKTDQNGNATQYGYTPAGVLQQVIDARGTVTGYQHDANGNLTQVIENRVDGQLATADQNVTTGYTYDPVNELLAQTDALGHTTKYTYAPLGGVATVTDPLGGVTKNAYDKSGVLSSVTTPDGKSTTLTRDGDGRVVTKAPGIGSAISYTYDQAGRLTGMKDQTGTTTWSFDKVGQQASETGPNGTTKYGYDKSGLRTSITTPKGVTSTNTIDRAGRITAVTDQTGTTRYEYNPLGLPTSVSRPNNTATTLTYDPAGNITGINHTGPQSSAPAPAPVAPAPPADPKTPSSAPSPAPTSTPTPQPSTSPSPSVSPSPASTPSPTPTPTPTPTSSSPAATAGAGIAPTPAPTPTVTSSPTPAPTVTPSPQTPAPAVPSPVPGATAPALTTPTTQGPGCGNGGSTPGCPLTALTAADALPIALTYTYDPDGNVSGQHQVSATKDLTTSYTYDKLNRLTSSTRSDSANSTYVYDAAGNRTDGTETDRYTGQILTVHATYSAWNQILTLTKTQASTSGPGNSAAAHQGNASTAPGSSSSYTYDANGNQVQAVTATTSSINGNSGHTDTTSVTHKYTYDSDRRMTADSGSDGSGTKYVYDGLGRTSAQTLVTPSTDPKSSSSSKSGKTGGPGCGNGGSTPGCPAVTAVSPFAGDTTRISYDGLNPIEWSTDKKTITTVNGPLGPDHQITATTAGSVPAWFHLDRIGSVRAITDSAGATIAASSFTDFGVQEPAYGTSTVSNGNNIPGTGGNSGNSSNTPNVHTDGLLAQAASITVYGYTATTATANQATGTQHYYARDYNPATAQWQQADPANGIRPMPASLAKYTYVQDNPQTYTDYLGYRPVGCALAHNCPRSGIDPFTAFTNWWSTSFVPWWSNGGWFDVLAVVATVAIEVVGGGPEDPIADGAAGGAIDGIESAKTGWQAEQRAAAAAQAEREALYNELKTENANAKSILNQAKQDGTLNSPTSGAATVEKGAAGERAAQEQYAIGKKESYQGASGQDRIADGVNDEFVSEVKNVQNQSLTSQLKDALAYAHQEGKQFQLIVAKYTVLSDPLMQWIAENGVILERLQ